MAKSSKDIFLFISNGHGEDLIAAEIIKELQQQVEPANIKAIAIVGTGKAYQDLNIQLLVQGKALPSGGFVMTTKDFLRDIRAGWFGQTLKQLYALWRIRKNVQTVFAVGDTVPLVLTLIFRKSRKYFLSSAKSILVGEHNKTELELMKRYISKTFARDQATADYLRTYGINAVCLGNPMMDCLKCATPLYSEEQKCEPPFYSEEQKCEPPFYSEEQKCEPPFYSPLLRGEDAFEVNFSPEKGRCLEATEGFKRMPIICREATEGFVFNSLRGRDTSTPLSDQVQSIRCIGILPGSRHEAYVNLEMISQVMIVLRQREVSQNYKFLVSVPPSLDLPKVQSIVGLADDVEFCDQFVEVLQKSEVIIGLAGTANEQAVGYGIPVVAFPASGPQTSHYRFRLQRRLLGGATTLLDSYSPDLVADAIITLLNDLKRCAEIKQIGQERMGKPGASRAIAEEILD